MTTKEGFVPFRSYRTWYRIVGDGEAAGKVPLLVVHGGPGLPHEYVETLEAMATTGRRVIFYDQVGCGNSDQPHDPSIWTMGLFVEELGVVRDALGLDRVHLLGQSCGGMLVMEYALTQPMGLASLIVADSSASIPDWIQEISRLRSELPAEVQATLRQHEAAGTTDDPAYQDAMMVFYRRHFCRVDPWPDCLNRAFDKLTKNPEVYNTMWGANEFSVTGTLKTWDITSRLGEIRVPTLIPGGRYDEATPLLTKKLYEGIVGSEWVIFENSSHLPHLEELDRYLEVLTGFLDRVESRV